MLFESMQRTIGLADLETLVKFTDELHASATATTSERQTDSQQTVVTALQNKVGGRDQGYTFFTVDAVSGKY